jgi:hypothetical protein
MKKKSKTTVRDDLVTKSYLDQRLEDFKVENKKQFEEMRLENKKQFEEMRLENKKQFNGFAQHLLTSMDSIIKDNVKVFVAETTDVRSSVKVLETKVKMLEVRKWK